LIEPGFSLLAPVSPTQVPIARTGLSATCFNIARLHVKSMTHRIASTTVLGALQSQRITLTCTWLEPCLHPWPLRSPLAYDIELIDTSELCCWTMEKDADVARVPSAKEGQLALKEEMRDVGADLWQEVQQYSREELDAENKLVLKKIDLVIMPMVRCRLPFWGV
jgi:hypothetical protein